ncbi:MAG: GIY-YIG nuclease family protein [Pseudomonadota bacterium]
MANPFTIRIYVPDGDPDGVRVIDRMNWTGRGVAFPRDVWDRAIARREFAKPGVYILVGRLDTDDEDDLPLLYIGQTDELLNRLGQHQKDKDFWDRAVVFISTNDGLNRAHITWLEHALIRRAKDIGQCHLDNGNSPKEPPLSEFEKADTEAFLREMIQILPLIGITAFERPRVINTVQTDQPLIPSTSTDAEIDTIIVPAKKDGFQRVFLGENAWWSVRISGGKIPLIRYIAAYQTQPISAVTHWAPVERIEPYGDTGKYRLIFAEPARKLEKSIPFGDAKQGSMQGSRYARLSDLLTAKTLGELFKE